MTGVDVLVQVGGGGGEHELAGRRSAVARRNLGCNFPYGLNMSKDVKCENMSLT